MRNIIKNMESNENVAEQIFCNEVAWQKLSDFFRQYNPSKVFIITDQNTQTHCLPYFREKIRLALDFHIIAIEAGEIHKNINTCTSVWATLAEKGADRNSVVINLGGGVITDLGGFVASTFNRGLKFIHVPTSLLAMVDAAVGGKNGIDLGHLKNKIGLVNPPQMGVVDTGFLKTLPREHLVSGLAEMLKHGLIFSGAYWEKVRNCNLAAAPQLEELIWESIEIKKSIVAQDPTEKNIRKTLNFGHTLGHAIESFFLENNGQKPLLHGEAVAAGIMMASYISSEICGFPKRKLQEVSSTICNYFNKITFTEEAIEAILRLLVFDKKSRNGQVLFVLLEDIGRTKIDCIVSNDLIYTAFGYYKNF